MAKITSGYLNRMGNETLNQIGRGQFKPGVGNCLGNKMKKKIGAPKGIKPSPATAKALKAGQVTRRPSR